MVRLKTPLLSMDAHGTIGNAVTFQSSTKRKFAREKPHLPYSLTLPQRYQRWLYEDYCALWHTQTFIQRAGYREAGSRVHLTAFQYFMKYHLRNLPDIIALWRLDSQSGGLTPDSGRGGLDLTVVGASDIEGLIARALYFDGINDFLSHTALPTYTIGTDDFTISFFVYFQSFLATGFNPFFGTVALPQIIQLDHRDVLTNLRFIIYVGAAPQITQQAWNPALLTWYHLAFRRLSAVTQIFVDGAPLGAPGNVPGAVDSTPAMQYIARHDFNMSNIRLDQFSIHSRGLSDTDIIRHAVRRYLS